MCPRADLTTPTPWHCRQRALGDLLPARAAAGAAVLLPRDRQRALAAAHRRLRSERDRLMQIGAALGVAFADAALALLAARRRTDRRRSTPTIR